MVGCGAFIPFEAKKRTKCLRAQPFREVGVFADARLLSPVNFSSAFHEKKRSLPVMGQKRRPKKKQNDSWICLSLEKLENLPKKVLF